MFLFVAVEGVRVAQRESDIVETVQQAILAEGIDVEVRLKAPLVLHRLLFEIDGDGVFWV